MKTRESGMPDEGMWETFFDPADTLARLGLTRDCGNVVEFGCGYGTFTIPAAKLVDGIVYALDIEPEMIAATEARALREGVVNIQAGLRDFVSQGTGLPEANAGFAMLFNLLHCEGPLELLREAHRVLRRDGILGVIHWRSDIETPRGPSLDIRPSPEACIAWAEATGFSVREPGVILLQPYHFGISFGKAA